MPMICADILKWAESYTGPKFHAALMDAPYEIAFMGRRWDATGISFRPETWAALAQHLYPGAWGMAFASSRGWHRMACAIEDAGLLIQPTIYGWSYGSGFPKSTSISPQIDAAAFRAWLIHHPEERQALADARAAERAARRRRDPAQATDARAVLLALTLEYKAAAGLLGATIATKRHEPKFAAAELGYREKDNGYNSRDRETFDVLDAATDAARHWLGHRYGGQVLKPALEPIIVFQKPYGRSPVQSIQQTGAGALWIDGARIGTDEDTARPPSIPIGPVAIGSSPGGMGGLGHPGGRWPANLYLQHDPACEYIGEQRIRGTNPSADKRSDQSGYNQGWHDRHAPRAADGRETIAAWRCIPSCPVARLGAQSGESRSAPWDGNRNTPKTNGVYGDYESYHERGKEGDTGTAARFFYQSDFQAERLELSDAIAYVAKASRAEREAGLDPGQIAIMRALDDSDDAELNETTIDDGRQTPIDNPYQRGETRRRNIHPTIKPIALARHLATLLLPPEPYAPRRLLIPFAGTGSEYIGAMLAGWEAITGIELSEEYTAIADHRIAYWKARAWALGDPARKITARLDPRDPDQLDMFTLEDP